jgi:hypothetical protein
MKPTRQLKSTTQNETHNTIGNLLCNTKIETSNTIEIFYNTKMKPTTQLEIFCNKKRNPKHN